MPIFSRIFHEIDVLYRNYHSRFSPFGTVLIAIEIRRARASIDYMVDDISGCKEASHAASKGCAVLVCATARGPRCSSSPLPADEDAFHVGSFLLML